MHKPITFTEAILPLVAMLLCLTVGGLIFPMGSELLIAVMLIAATVAGLIARRHGHGWAAIQHSAGEKLASVLPAILILFSIGMLIGTWMFSGTIPLLVYYGIQLVNPEYMILTAFLATSAMSLTGSSWASAGTIGVALMGVASAMGAPLAATAGAVVSGAYFGDKLSPLSDSTNICAIGAKANLYDHVQNMLYTTLPSFVIAAIVYFFAGGVAEDQLQAGSFDNKQLLQEIDQIYQIHWLAFLPALIVFIGTVKRLQAVFTMVTSSLVAMFIGVMLHGFSITDALFTAVSGFNIEMVNNTAPRLGEASEILISLLNRGGVYSMTNTLVLIIVAFLLAAGMDVSGGLDKLLHTMLKRVSSVFGLVAATMTSGLTMIALTSHAAVTSLMVGGLFQDAYREHKLAPENLSRAVEDSVTITESLMPWTVSAMFMATTLGVSTVDYMPWAVFCMTGFIFSLLLAGTFPMTGFGLRKLEQKLSESEVVPK